MKRCIGWVLLAVLSCGVAQAQDTILVGRVAYIEGEVLRYVPAEQDWVATLSDTPLGMEDVIYTDAEARAEFIFPNNTLVRVGGATGFDAVTIRGDATVAYVDSGMVRLYNRGKAVLVRLETRWGYVLAEPGDIVDIYVGENEAEVIALEGAPSFFYSGRGGEETRYEVFPDGSSLLIDDDSVEAADPYVDAAWNRWNYDRDQLRVERANVRSAYLPEQFQDDAHVFEKEGRWEQVQYEGRAVQAWRPAHVEESYAPYTVGRWTTYSEENVWVPYEPWGWVTHHHGH
jgi:hypothetical protein